MGAKKTKNLPVRVLKIWFDIVLVLGSLSALIFLGWLALSPFLMAGGEMPSDANVKVAVGERSWFPVMPLEFEPLDPSEDPQITEARLSGARGELSMLTTSWWLQFVSLGGIILAIVVILYVIWLLRRVLVNVLEDRPFDAINGSLLRRCGYIILVLGVVWPPFEYALSDYVLSTIDISTIDLRPAITFEKDTFVVGLLFLVFGIILTRGHELQEHEQALEEEQAYTV